MEATFYFDFGSPNAYLAHKVLPGIAQRTGAAFTYVPVLLGGIFKATGNRSPMEAFAGIPAKLAYENLEMQRFIAKHGLSRFRMNSHFPVNTLMMMRGAAAAQLDGTLMPYVEVCFRAMWEESVKMDDATTMQATLDAGGLDGAAIMARIQQQDAKDLLMQNTNAAVARGVFGIPTFFVGDAIFFGKDRLRDVEEAIAAS
ncbi:2-hydroxychromene-2-carboxylate isomerase [Zavarzinia sp. CC-PAN008]|uniref:2-hydroxychromene-2-carboxylate isomerase n=1 Tax=Zavarzinia sp. CC-PAN008 TaxID=3243332 RepID=UPI003F747523